MAGCLEYQTDSDEVQDVKYCNPTFLPKFFDASKEVDSVLPSALVRLRPKFLCYQLIRRAAACKQSPRVIERFAGRRSTINSCSLAFTTIRSFLQHANNQRSAELLEWKSSDHSRSLKRLWFGAVASHVINVKGNKELLRSR